MLEKRLKNRLSLMVLFAASLTGLFSNQLIVHAEDASVHFGSTSYSTNEGESFPVGVYINTESGVGSYVVTVSYDPTKLQYVGGADGADPENGMLAFVGESGGPEVKYMVNFVPIGEGASDSSISIASAEVYTSDTGEAFNTSVAGAAPVSVAAAEEEEEEEEEEETLEEDAEETLEEEAETQVVADTNTVDQETDADSDALVSEVDTETVEAQAEETTENKSILYNTYFVLGGIFVGLIIFIQVVFGVITRIYKKRIEEMGRVESVYEEDDDEDDSEYYIDREDDSDYITPPIKNTKSSIHLVGNLPVMDLDMEMVTESPEVIQNKMNHSFTEKVLNRLTSKKEDITLPETKEVIEAPLEKKYEGVEESSEVSEEIDAGVEEILENSGVELDTSTSQIEEAGENQEESVDENKPVISVDDVTMEFHIASSQSSGLKDYIIQFLKRQITYRKLFALYHVSFNIYKGEIVGIIGTNGSGKSTLLKIVSGALRPTEGEVKADRKKIQLLTLGTGFDMELTGRENVYLNGAIIGYSKEFLDEHYDEIVKFAELEDFMDEKVKNYSSGMVSRLGFAIATAGDAAEILILDEVLSVGDEFFRKKSLKRVKEMIHGGSTVLLVSHSMGTIIDNCTKCVWIEKGELKMVDEPKIVCDAYSKMKESEAV